MAKKKPSHRRKRVDIAGIFKWLKWVLILLIVLGLTFLFTAKPVFNIDIMEKIRQKRTQSGSEAILTKVQDIFLFQTVEYVYKTVFPYDFVSPDYDWRALLDKEALGQNLNANEREHLRIYRFCEDIGITLQSNRYEFVVITSVVRGGFNLEGTVYQPQETTEDIEEYIRIDNESKTLYLRLPPPVITAFETEDLDRERYPYPDLAISPDNWKRLTQFTANEIEVQVLEDGILELAKQRGKVFIEKLLLDSGLETIVFIEP